MTDYDSRRVLHLRSSGGVLGAEQVILSLCLHAQQFGYEPYLAVIRDASNEVPQLLSSALARGIKAVPIDCRSRFDLGAIKQLRRLIRTLEIDILHCHGYREDFYAVFSSAGAKLVTTNHLWKRTSAALRFYAKLDGYLMRRFDSVVAVSRDIFDELHRLGIRGSRLTYIPNGIDVERFGADRLDGAAAIERRDELGIGAADIVLATTGSLTDEKGHRFMLQALAASSSLDRVVVWLVVGDGEQVAPLRQLAAELNLGGRVRFLGRREDIPEILAVTDIFVLPSLVEGLPIALLEAMAAGKACVATRVGDVREVIETGVTGLVVERANANELGAAVETLVRDVELRSRLGYEARKAVSERYSARSMTEAYCEIYDGLLD